LARKTAFRQPFVGSFEHGACNLLDVGIVGMNFRHQVGIELGGKENFVRATFSPVKPP
jgi:hypothetical protein